MIRLDWRKIPIDEMKEMIDEHLESYENPSVESPLSDYKLSMMCLELIRRLEKR